MYCEPSGRCPGEEGGRVTPQGLGAFPRPPPARAGGACSCGHAALCWTGPGRSREAGGTQPRLCSLLCLSYTFLPRETPLPEEDVEIFAASSCSYFQ